MATGGGTDAAISAINRLSMTPGPLGIEETSPRADAPAEIARLASTTLEMQQILINGSWGILMGVDIPWVTSCCYANNGIGLPFRDAGQW